ncbi:ribosome recycling factor domain-containing protein [Irpex rosettiformis]|uniref:Ribosome recycling factor domain-containing protein n=1 Tax=Irpex rosettiformis TaxID=378272 RepID=A0ACB8U5P0_9APHY|nr:ribosome recycling factor domain-containing protein [Irpex rosettiformis]
MSFLRSAVSRVGRAQLQAQLTRQTPSLSPCILRTAAPGAQQTRFYASKKKSKHAESTEEAFVPGSQRIAAGESYVKAEESMKSTVERFRKEVSGLETRASGRVTTGLLAPVRVKLPDGDSKGVRLEEVATVGVRDGTTLIVTVFEEHTLKHVEQAVYDAKLPGLNPQRADSRTIKIPVPKPTVEARHALYTTAQRHAEEARVHIRKQHSASVKKGGFKKFTQEFDELQELTDKYIKEVDKVLADLKKSTGAK